MTGQCTWDGIPLSSAHDAKFSFNHASQFVALLVLPSQEN